MLNTNIIDIGEKAPLDIQNVLGYYAPMRRTTENGVIFMTYFGLRQYFVTGGFDSRLLAMEDPELILNTSREHKWRHVGDLRLRLMGALVHNVKLNHAVVEHIKPEHTLTWICRGRPRLSKQEVAWLEIVRAVVGSQ